MKIYRNWRKPPLNLTGSLLLHILCDVDLTEPEKSIRIQEEFTFSNFVRYKWWRLRYFLWKKYVKMRGSSGIITMNKEPLCAVFPNTYDLQLQQSLSELGNQKSGCLVRESEN